MSTMLLPVPCLFAVLDAVSRCHTSAVERSSFYSGSIFEKGSFLSPSCFCIGIEALAVCAQTDSDRHT